MSQCTEGGESGKLTATIAECLRQVSLLGLYYKFNKTKKSIFVWPLV